MSTELLTRPATTSIVPKVNLLPPEIAEAARLRGLKVQLGAGVVASLGVVGLLFMVASGQVADANAELEAAQAATAKVQTEVAALAEVPKVYAEVATAQSQLTQAMGDEVRWSNLLTDVSLTVPPNVALEKLTVTQNVQGAEQTALSPLGTQGIATVAFEGNSATPNDLATFLDRLAKQNNQMDPFYTEGTYEEDTDSKRDVFAFDASTTVNEAAKSNRYTEGG